MASAFERTLRALAADRSRASAAGIALAGALLAGWAVWATRAQVTVYAVTDQARIEVEQRAYAVDAPVAGRIVRFEPVIGREVHTGDVLVQLDTELARRQLDSKRATLAALDPQIQALERELDARKQALGDQERATLSALDESRARLDEARVTAEQAHRQAKRAGGLVDSGVVAVADAERLAAEAEERNAGVEAVERQLERLEREQRTRGSEALATFEQLRGRLAALQGERATTEADVRVLEQTIDLSTVRAPTSGRIGEAALLNAGAYAHEGDRLCVVVPPGELRAVADFAPAEVLGRARPGQSARLRLDGFPWMYYGTVPATIVRVGSELRDGRVRVELALQPDPLSRIPLQHGLPATAEIDVERLTPARLVMRSMGTVLGRRAVGAGGGV